MKNTAIVADFATILSLRMPRLCTDDARARLADALKKPSSCTKVYTPNPQIALGAYRSSSLTAILNRADLLLPDGIGLVIASRILGTPLPDRITGIDTGRYVLEIAEREGLSVALVGARDGVADRAAEKLCRELPRLKICYTHHGYFSHEGKENVAVLDALRAAAPDILFVCFGSPAQETWIDRYAASIPSLRLCMGLGGSLDVWAGNVRRAPKWVSACGSEWLWRVLREPRRAKIFAQIPYFFLLVLRQKNKKKRAASDRTGSATALD